MSRSTPPEIDRHAREPFSRLGATYLGDRQTAFHVWAPHADALEVVVVSQQERTFALRRTDDGYHQAVVSGVGPGEIYCYRFSDGRLRPDPASRSQPQGVHQPSAVTNADFNWSLPQWRGIPWHEYILYELHVGTFSSESTFDGVIQHLGELASLGITAIELMPVAQFPGQRNWGYDGVHPFAAQNSYGGPEGLKRLVDAAHQHGLAVVLDVVYNHVGPEGNYLGEFGPYFSDLHRTPWGESINFDGPDSDHVRRYFIDNALEWISDFQIDALRLDAVHAIFDQSARPFLLELATAVKRRAAEIGRHVYLIAESNLNDPRHVMPEERGGYGLDAQWNDDLEHVLRVELTGNADGYYSDYRGLEKLAKAYRDGFVIDGGLSKFRRRRFGASSHSLGSEQLVVFSQNHDQVGNRPCGERLCALVDFESAKLAAAAVLLSPNIPLLFMGEEYAEPAPFLYFVSHSDKALQDAVRHGRRAEFADFDWPEHWPDPNLLESFNHSRLDRRLASQGTHQAMYEYYQLLIHLRRTHPALKCLSKEQCAVSLLPDSKVLGLRRWDGSSQACLLLNFADKAATAACSLPEGRWRKEIDSADVRWAGAGVSVSAEIASTGVIQLSLPRRSAVLLIQM